MSSPETLTLPISYFGKLPSHGDFLRGVEHRSLINVLDQWVSEGLELLTENVAWKSFYDAAHAVDFAFLGSRNRSVIGGRLLPSKDASGRRFPFMAAVTFEVVQPMDFIPHSPQAMARLWSRLGRELAQAKAAIDPTEDLKRLTEQPITLTIHPNILQSSFVDFLDTQTVGSLQTMLNDSGHHVDIRRVLIGLGILMKPVRASDAPKMGKGLQLPLPADPMYRQLVSTFWLDLITGFLGRTSFELMIVQRTEPVPLLTVGFGGVCARGLYGIFDPRIEAQDTIMLEDPDWVEYQVQQHQSLRKISSYISQSDLSLHTARTTFLETFLET